MTAPVSNAQTEGGVEAALTHAPELTGMVVLGRVLAFRHPEDERKRVYVSFCKRPSRDFGTMADPTVSFAWVEHGAAVEWEVQHGPIQQLFAAHEGDPEREGYIFAYHRTDCGMCWSQHAVDNYGLPGAAISGNYEYVWQILKQWHQRTPDGPRTYCGDDA